VLDLARPDDVARLGDLLAAADVLLDSTPRGALEAHGLDPGAFTALVHGRLTPFGDDGPWADYKASDLVSLALGGVPMNCGYDPLPDGHHDLPPVAPQAWHSFHIAGEHLAMGIVSALIRRQRTGGGQRVEVSIHEAVSKNTELDVTSWIMMRQPVHRQTCRHASAQITDPSISYTKDGRWLLSMSLGRRDLNRLAPFMRKYGLGVDLEDSGGDGAETVRAIGGSTAAATSGTEMVQRLARRFTYAGLPWREAQDDGLLWAPIRKPRENAEDEHWLLRGTFAEIEHPELDRSLRYPVSKWISTAGSWRAGRRAPRLGEATGDAGATGDAPTARTRAVPAAAPRRTPDDRADMVSALGRPFPLQGVRVLDFTWFLASAGATRFLASLGADVLKVEWKTHPDSGRGFLVPEGGRAARDRATEPLHSVRDPTIGGQFNNKNPGKRGLSLNVADPRGLEIAKALVPRCDIVAEGFSPGVMERWGLGYEVLTELRPDIIYVKQSGMGAIGTYGRFRCLGPIAAALSGVSDMSGMPEPAPPAGWGYSYLDWFGAYSMALATLAALYHRDRTGEGQWIDASQTEAGIWLTPVQILDWGANGREWQRFGNRSPYKPAAPHGIYRCAGDDRWIAIACFTDDEWRGLATVAGHTEWLADARFARLADRLSRQDALEAHVTAWTRDQDAFRLMTALQAAGVPAGVCQTAEDRCERDPQLRHLEWLTELDSTRLGRWPVAETSIRMSESPAHVGGLTHRGAPLYGEDNVSVLTELLGMSEPEIAELAAEGVL
jgi:crotonobetainyl-CoA:carnitine CoA-transferase CaiB-like acyl-CoA transferase